MPKIINLDSPVEGLQGFKIANDMTGKSLTYRESLLTVCELARPVPGKGDAFRAYEIGLKVVNAGQELELTVEEINFLKDLIGKSSVYVSVILGRLRDYLIAAK